MASSPEAQSDTIIKAAFGAKNRARLIDLYFESCRDASSTPPSGHVYRLLLWADQTTGLAHCYESDKSQPGKNWYARSLAFHDWVSTALKSTPSTLAKDIDWLFHRATADLAVEVLNRAARVSATAAQQ